MAGGIVTEVVAGGVPVSSAGVVKRSVTGPQSSKELSTMSVVESVMPLPVVATRLKSVLQMTTGPITSLSQSCACRKEVPKSSKKKKVNSSFLLFMIEVFVLGF